MSKIIEINQSTEQQAEQPKPLTAQQIQNIGAAYARLIELKSQKVLTVNTETEVRGLLEFLSSELIAHADELIASWLAVRTEYEPILHCIARAASRINGIQAAHTARRAAAVTPAKE